MSEFKQGLHEIKRTGRMPEQGGNNVEIITSHLALDAQEQAQVISMLSARNVVRQTYRGEFGSVWTTWYPNGASFRFPTYAGALRAATRGKPEVVETLQGLPVTGDYNDACARQEQEDREAGAGSEVRDTPPREEEGCP